MRDVEHPSLSQSPSHHPEPPDLLTGCLGLERPQSVLWPPSVLSRPPQYAPHSPLQILEPSETSILHFWQKVEFSSRYILYQCIYVCLKFECIICSIIFYKLHIYVLLPQSGWSEIHWNTGLLYFHTIVTKFLEMSHFISVSFQVAQTDILSKETNLSHQPRN